MPARVGFAKEIAYPEIRFADDTQNWDNAKIGSLLKEYSEKNHEMFQCVAVGRYGIRKREDIYDKELTSNLGGNKVIRQNTLTIGMGSKQIDVGVLKENMQYSVSPAYHTFDIVNSNPAFLETVFLKENERLSLAHMIVGARQGKSVDIEGFMNDSISLPASHVQSEIALLFSLLDTLIANEAQAVEQLKVLKSAMLQNMFPKAGSDVPEIRFAGFTGAWEQRKLGDVLRVATRRNGNSYRIEDVLSVSDEYGCVNQIKFQGRSFAGADISNYKIVRTGDVVYTRSPLQAKPFGIIKVVREEIGIVSPLYIVNETTEGNDAEFIYCVFDLPYKTNNYLSPLVRKGAKNTMNISEDEWLSGEIMVAPSYEEQQIIGQFFKEFDNLITLHQCKYEKLVQIKRAMLEKMLV